VLLRKRFYCNKAHRTLGTVAGSVFNCPSNGSSSIMSSEAIFIIVER